MCGTYKTILTVKGVANIYECEARCDLRDLWCSHVAYNSKKKQCDMFHDRDYCKMITKYQHKGEKGWAFSRKMFIFTDRDWIKLDGLCYNVYFHGFPVIKDMETVDRCKMMCTKKLKDECAYIAYNPKFTYQTSGKVRKHCMYYDLKGKGNNDAVCYYMPYKHPLLGTFHNLTKTAKSSKFFSMRHRLHPSAKHIYYRRDGKDGKQKARLKWWPKSKPDQFVEDSTFCGELAKEAGADFFAFGRTTPKGIPTDNNADTECIIYFDSDPYQEADYEEWGLTFFLNTKYAKQALRFRPKMDEEEYVPVDRFGQVIEEQVQYDENPYVAYNENTDDTDATEYESDFDEEISEEMYAFAEPPMEDREPRFEDLN